MKLFRNGIEISEDYFIKLKKVDKHVTLTVFKGHYLHNLYKSVRGQNDFSNFLEIHDDNLIFEYDTIVQLTTERVGSSITDFSFIGKWVTKEDYIIKKIIE